MPIAFQGSATTTPGQVFVRYLLADSTAEMYNVRSSHTLAIFAFWSDTLFSLPQITWAGQIAGSGGEYSSDGTLEGTVETVTMFVQSFSLPIPSLSLPRSFVADVFSPPRG